MPTDSASNIDGMWKLLDEVLKSLKGEMIYDDNLTNAKPSSINGLYKNLASLEAALYPIALNSEWDSDKRQRWLQEINEASKYSQAHFTSCLLTFEGELRTKSQEPMWMKLHRRNWIGTCVQLGADRLELRKQTITHTVKPERTPPQRPAAALQQYRPYTTSSDKPWQQLIESTKTKISTVQPLSKPQVQSSNSKPQSSTSKQLNTTKPQSSTTESTITEPHSSCIKPQSSSTEPQSSTIEPESSTTESQWSSKEPQLSTTEPQLSTAEPQLSTTEPQLSTTEPKHANEQRPRLCCFFN